MRQDIQDFIDETMPYQGSFKELAAMLPSDDAELDELLAETIRKRDGRAFPFCVIAALHANRKVDSRHLEVGILFIKGYVMTLSVTWKVQGDTPKHLLAAMRNSALDLEMQAAVFFFLAAWVQEGRGEIPRNEVIAAARIFARKLPPRSDSIFTVLCAAHMLKDDGLKEVLSQFHKPIPEEKITDLVEGFMKICKRPILEGVAARPDGNISHGKTLRRSVERVGRNDPCPCGSGKKYKHCCIEKDEVRLNQSTEVKGVTRSELRESPEMFLNPERMARCNPPDLLSFDPRKIAPYLLPDYFHHLGRFRMLDKVAESFEQLGWSEDLQEIWDRMMFWAHHHRCKNVAERLVRVRPNAADVEQKLHVSFRLLLAEDNPAKVLELLMEQVGFTLEAETPDMLLSLALALLPTKLSPLGIFIARGVLPFISDDDAQIVYYQILRARDLLNLPPEDLYTDIMEERLAKKPVQGGQDSEKLQVAQQKLEDKAKEVRQLKEAMHALEREIELREKNTRVSHVPTNIIALPNQNVLSELRNKVESLKTDLKERHNERNELRRELQKAQTDIEELRQKSGIVVDVDRENLVKEEEEKTLLLPEETLGNQPVRLIEFPKKFEERLASFPRHVSRNAMKTLGELAGGEPAAFMGVVRLKACPTISRQRIGIDVRLLFRILPDRVQVVDLINRKDLERRIKTLV